MRRDRVTRIAAWSLIGYVGEVAYTGAADALIAHRPQPRLRTSPWMFVVYGLIQPLYEPVHRGIRGRRLLERGLVYGIGFTGAEYATGRLLRRVRGQAPWSYAHARWNLHGVARPSYLPLWAVVGLALEPVHDRLERGSR